MGFCGSGLAFRIDVKLADKFIEATLHGSKTGIVGKDICNLFWGLSRMLFDVLKKDCIIHINKIGSQK